MITTFMTKTYVLKWKTGTMNLKKIEECLKLKGTNIMLQSRVAVVAMVEVAVICAFVAKEIKLL